MLSVCSLSTQGKQVNYLTRIGIVVKEKRVNNFMEYLKLTVHLGVEKENDTCIVLSYELYLIIWLFVS